MPTLRTQVHQSVYSSPLLVFRGVRTVWCMVLPLEWTCIIIIVFGKYLHLRFPSSLLLLCCFSFYSCEVVLRCRR